MELASARPSPCRTGPAARGSGDSQRPPRKTTAGAPAAVGCGIRGRGAAPPAPPLPCLIAHLVDVRACPFFPPPAGPSGFETLLLPLPVRAPLSRKRPQ